MVSLFFIIFLDIFEPFSIYFLVKLIESFKDVKKAISRSGVGNLAKATIAGIIIGFLLAAGFLSYRVIVSSIFLNINTVQYDTFFWLTQNFLAFLISAALVLLVRRWNWSVFGSSVITYFSILFSSLFIFSWYTEQWYMVLGFPSNANFPSYAGIRLIEPFITLTSGISGTVNLKWLTAVWKGGIIGDYQFIVPELHQIPVIWQGIGGRFLQFLSIPYNFLHPLAIILTYGGIFFLAGREFHVRTQKGEEKQQFKSIFSDVTRLPSISELNRKADIFLITATPTTDSKTKELINQYWAKIERGETLRNTITGNMMTISKLSQSLDVPISEIYEILDKVTYDAEIPFNRIITLWQREFAYSFEEVTIDSLHVMMLDGRAVLSHTFGEESQVEPALVAGLFSAITSFAKEAVRSEQLLKTIDHGDVVLTIEYAKWVFAAIFADSTSTELRKKLGEFLTDFETRHAKTLPKWLGDLDRFADENANVDARFAGG